MRWGDSSKLIHMRVLERQTRKKRHIARTAIAQRPWAFLFTCKPRKINSVRMSVTHSEMSFSHHNMIPD